MGMGMGTRPSMGAGGSLYLPLLAAVLIGSVAQVAQAQPTCDVDFNNAGGGAFTQALCESPTFGGGQGFVLASPLPSGASHPVLAPRPLSLSLPLARLTPLWNNGDGVSVLV
jgi:hypothetical protein